MISTHYREAQENPGAGSQQHSYSKLTLSTSILQGLAFKKRNPSFSTETSLHSSASLSWTPPFKEQLSFKQMFATCYRNLCCAFGPRDEGKEQRMIVMGNMLGYTRMEKVDSRHLYSRALVLINSSPSAHRD